MNLSWTLRWSLITWCIHLWSSVCIWWPNLRENLWSKWYLRKDWYQGSSCSRRIWASATCSVRAIRFAIGSNSWTASLVWAGWEGKRDGPIAWNAYPLHLHLNTHLHRRCSFPRLLGHQLCSDSDFVDCQMGLSGRYPDQLVAHQANRGSISCQRRTWMFV